MSIVIYSDELLQKITSNVWCDSVLDVSEQYLTEEKIEAICEALTHNTYIKTLELSHSNITVRAAQALANNKSLSKLIVSYCALDNAEAQVLAQTTTLAELVVDNNNIRDEGIIALARNKVLITLDMRFNRCGEQGAQVLMLNTTLTTLHIMGNNITKQDEAKVNNRIKRNQQIHQGWMLAAPLMAFARANSKHSFKTSYLALASNIAALADEKTQDKQLMPIKLDGLFDTLFLSGMQKNHTQ